jgi:transposase
MPIPWTILPDTDRLQLIPLTTTTTAITAVVETVSASAACPLCGQPSSHVHSRYVRSVADVPWHEAPFRLRLHVRRFFCDASTCVRRIFTERLPGLVAPYARRTQRLDAWLRASGVALGGEEGARLLCALGRSEAHGYPASPDTLLRRVRAPPDPEAPSPRVVGVDDWCFLRGRRYGAILVDLERHCPLDLLPNRESETLANWLKAHPSITVISRDRGGSFAEGATRGAPQAAQVADRFHLLKTLVEAFQQLLGREQLALRAAAEATMGAPLLPTTRPLTAPVREARATTRVRRQERYETVRRLRAEGKPIHEIALILRMGHTTIQRRLQAETCPVAAQRRTRTTLLTAFEPYVRERWNSGEQNGKQLLREIRAQDYHGGESTL